MLAISSNTPVAFSSGESIAAHLVLPTDCLNRSTAASAGEPLARMTIGDVAFEVRTNADADDAALPTDVAPRPEGATNAKACPRTHMPNRHTAPQDRRETGTIILLCFLTVGVPAQRTDYQPKMTHVCWGRMLGSPCPIMPQNMIQLPHWVKPLNRPPFVKGIQLISFSPYLLYTPLVQVIFTFCSAVENTLDRYPTSTAVTSKNQNLLYESTARNKK